MSQDQISAIIEVEVEGEKYVRRVTAEDATVLEVGLLKALKELKQTLIVKHNK